MEESGKMRRCCQDICALWHYESYATMSGENKKRKEKFMIKAEKLSYSFPQKDLYNKISFTLKMMCTAHLSEQTEPEKVRWWT